MKLYRNISTNELYRLFVDGEVNGKLHKSNQDTTYNPDEHGEVMFFFDYPAWLPYFYGYTVMLEVEVDEKDVVGEGKSIYKQNLSHYETNKYVSITWRREIYLRKYTSSQVTKIWTQMETLENAILDDFYNNDVLFLFELYASDKSLSELTLYELRKEFNQIKKEKINKFIEVAKEENANATSDLLYIYNFVKNYYNVIKSAEKDDYNLPSVMSAEGALKTEIIEKYSRKGAVVK